MELDFKNMFRDDTFGAFSGELKHSNALSPLMEFLHKQMTSLLVETLCTWTKISNLDCFTVEKPDLLFIDSNVAHTNRVRIFFFYVKAVFYY